MIHVGRFRWFAQQPGLRLAAVLAGLLVLDAWAAPIVGQVETVLSERELEYRSALNSFQAAVDARSAAEVRFSRASLEVDEARSSGDQGRLGRALASAQAQAVELQRLDRRVREANQQLEEARTAFLAALDGRLESLYAEFQGSVLPDERRAVAAMIQDLRNQVSEVSGEGDLAQRIELVAMPEVNFDPRDGPLELRLKAEIAERWAERFDSILVIIDSEVEELREQQRREESFEQFMAGIDRFDDARVPVVAPPATDAGRNRARTSEASAADSTTTTPQQATLTAEDRIERLLIYGTQIEAMRDEMRIRARVFRQRSGGISQ